MDRQTVMTWRAVLLVSVACLTAVAAAINVEFVAFGSRLPTNYAQLAYLGPAASVAVDEMNSRYSGRVNGTLTYVYDDYVPNAMNEYTGRQVAEWYYRQRTPQILSVLLIPNGIILSDLSYLIEQWDFLYISLIAATPAIRNRTRNPHWISMGRLNFPAISQFFLHTLDTFNWTTFAMVVDLSSTDFYRSVADRIAQDATQRSGVEPLKWKINASEPGYDFSGLLAGLRNATRMIMYFGHARYLRKFMVAAYTMDMTNGEYVYFGIEPMKNEIVYGKMHWKYADDDDTAAQQAFQSLLVFRTGDYFYPPNTQLGMDILERTRRDFNFSYDILQQPYQSLASPYGAVSAVAEILSDWLATNGTDLVSGSALAQRMYDRAFESPLGTVYIDNYGERQLDSYFFRFDAAGSQVNFLYKPANRSRLTQLQNLTSWSNRTWPPPNEPFCGYRNEKLACRRGDKAYIGTVVGSTMAAVFAIVTGIVVYIRIIKRNVQRQENTWWMLDESAITLEPSMSRSTTTATNSVVAKSAVSGFSKRQYMSTNQLAAKYHDTSVIVEIVAVADHELHLAEIGSNRFFMPYLNKLRYISHENIVRTIGLTVLPADKKSALSVVSEALERGCLYNLFHSPINWDFSLTASLILDFLEGLQFIHASSLEYHGDLSGYACHLDNFFTLKIGGLVNVRLQNAVRQSPDVVYVRHRADTIEHPTAKIVQKHDIHATGIILYEILSRQEISQKESTSEIQFTGSVPLQAYETLIRSCLAYNTTAKTVRSALADISPVFSIRKSGVKLVDRIQQRLADYARELENEVAVRTKYLAEEMERCDRIIAQFLPRWIANRIRSGESVTPELFDNVTILFAQLCGLSLLAQHRTPDELISSVGESEAVLDRITASYLDDVYKVEAVDDSYLVVSGLPVRNGDRHAFVIVELSTRMLQTVRRNFAHHVALQCGVHSGSCAAGVVGFRRLRYCLFGDTVNTASRVCLYGMPNRIHVSRSTAALLDQSAVRLQSRGMISMKGKEQMETFWLVTLD